MKRVLVFFSLLFAVAAGYAQKIIPSTIFIIDTQSGAQVAATSDAAMAFKNALIALVSNTNTARVQQVARFGPGKRSYFIQQLDPQANGNAYQLTLQRTFIGQSNIVYTFQYNVDQNKLYFLDPNTQAWTEELVQGMNEINLNNCYKLGMFNQQNAQPAQPMTVADNSQQADNGPAADNNDAAPVDTSVSANTAPPAIPDYEQPECPQDGYLWQPGYWAYSVDNANYYWVPGVWVAPPVSGYLWTPPYWAFDGGLYVFHTGYWGDIVGFYGGIDYGFGYGGVGFVGGEWRDGFFAYNTAVLRVGFSAHTYVNARFSGRIIHHESFNGRGGRMARPNARELEAARGHHIMATSEQIRNQRVARADKGQFAGPGGKPGKLANARAPENRGGATNRAGTAGTNNRAVGANNRQGGMDANYRPGNNAGRQAGPGAGRPGTPGAPGPARQGAPGGPRQGAPGAPRQGAAGAGRQGAPAAPRNTGGGAKVSAPKSKKH
jgi:hypothetical protein